MDFTYKYISRDTNKNTCFVCPFYYYCNYKIKYE